MASHAPIEPLREGYRLRLGAPERALLRELCEDLRRQIEGQDPGVARLFPAAYPEDPDASAEYDRLVRDDLVGRRIKTLQTVERTLDADRLDEGELDAWCRALTDFRLVLGERLGVTEDLYEDGIDPRDPRAPELGLFAWLTWLQSAAVEGLASRL
jgi:hypothetical protein